MYSTSCGFLRALDTPLAALFSVASRLFGPPLWGERLGQLVIYSAATLPPTVIPAL